MSNTLNGTLSSKADVKGKVNVGDGASAYEVAKRNGFEGTEKEWLESLNGEATAIVVKAEGKTIVLNNSSDLTLRSLTADGTVIIEGKNICPRYVSGAFGNTDGEPISSASYFRTEKIRIPEGAKLAVSNGINQVINSIHYWDKDGVWIGRSTPTSLNNRPTGAAYMGINFWTSTDLQWVQVEVNTETTEYEAYKGKQIFNVGDDATKLHTHYPITTIYGAESSVEYVADAKLYIDASIKAALSQANKITSVTLSASKWVGTASPYSQAVTISGATKNSKIDLNPSIEQLSIFHNKDLSFVVENNDGVTTVYCIGQKPANDYTIQATITEVAING